MIYLFNLNLTGNKLVFLSFMQIYGIGKWTSILLCKKLGFSLNFKIQNLSKNQLNNFKNVIESLNLVLGWNLEIQQIWVKEKLIEIKSYKGFRKLKRLPVRGQRTRVSWGIL